MTDNITDKAEAICLKRLDLIALERELDIQVPLRGVPTNSLRDDTGDNQHDRSVSIGWDTSNEESHEAVAGTAILSGNAECITTTTPIKSTLVFTAVVD